jgi:hypothetical protein
MNSPVWMIYHFVKDRYGIRKSINKGLLFLHFYKVGNSGPSAFNLSFITISKVFKRQYLFKEMPWNEESGRTL